MSMERDSWMREVDEELRRERLQKIWQRYGGLIVGAVALVLIGLAGYQWWQTQRVAVIHDSGARFSQAMRLAQDGKTAEATQALEAIVSEGGGGYPALARLALAANLTKAGKVDEAAAAYQTAADATDDPLIKGFAQLQAVSLKIDTADWTTVKNQLTDLAAETSPWRYSARELLGISALRAGKLSEARQALAPLSVDPKAPTALRQRAEALMQLVVATELAKTAPAQVQQEATPPPAGGSAGDAGEDQREAPASASGGPTDAGGDKK